MSKSQGRRSKSRKPKESTTSASRRIASAEPVLTFGLQPDGWVYVPHDPDIATLAQRVRSRRAEMGWTQAAVAQRGGPSAGTVSEIELQKNPLPVDSTLTKLDHGLGWESGTSDTILRGGVPGEQVQAAFAEKRLLVITPVGSENYVPQPYSVEDLM